MSRRLFAGRSSPVIYKMASETKSFCLMFYAVFGVVLVGSTLSSLVTGFSLATSYLILPTETACSHWSSSITVVGGAVMFAISGLSGVIIVPLLPKRSTRTWLLTSAVASGLGFGVCGVAVATCHWSNVATQIFYVLGYVFIGYGCYLPVAIVSVALIPWMPRYKAFAAGYSSLLCGLGSLAISQLLLYCQTLIKNDVLDVVTVFFGCGILVVFFYMCGMFLIVPPSFDTNSTLCDESVSNKNSSGMTRFRIMRTRQFILIFIGRVVGPFCGYGLTARQQEFLDTIWRHEHTPTAILGASVFGSYIGGRIFWLIMCEKMSCRWCWCTSLAIQAVAIAFLPLFTYSSDSIWMKYAALIDFCVINITFPSSKMTSFGLCLEIFGSVNYVTAYGMSVMGLGVAGFLAPLAFEWSLMIWSTYTPILYASAAANIIALIASLCLSPIHFDPIE